MGYLLFSILVRRGLPRPRARNPGAVPSPGPPTGSGCGAARDACPAPDPETVRDQSLDALSAPGKERLGTVPRLVAAPRQEQCVYIKIFIQDLRVCGRIENIDKIFVICSSLSLSLSLFLARFLSLSLSFTLFLFLSLPFALFHDPLSSRVDLRLPVVLRRAEYGIARRRRSGVAIRIVGGTERTERLEIPLVSRPRQTVLGVPGVNPFWLLRSTPDLSNSSPRSSRYIITFFHWQTHSTFLSHSRILSLSLSFSLFLIHSLSLRFWRAS